MQTLTVVGDVNAVGTRVPLTSQGSVSAPSRVVPAGMTKIKSIMVAMSSDFAADDGAAAGFIRLGGNAVKNGESNIFFGGVGGQTVQSGSDAAPGVMTPFVLEDLDLEVSPSDTIEISAEIAGVDPGDTHIAVTIVWGK